MYFENNFELLKATGVDAREHPDKQHSTTINGLRERRDLVAS